MKLKDTCPDCAHVPVVHAFEWWSSFLDWLIEPLTRPPEYAWRAIAPVFYWLPFEKIGVVILRIMAALRLGRIIYEPDEEDTHRTTVLWEEARKRGIDMWEFRLFGRPEQSVLAARFRGKLRLFEGLPRPRRTPSISLDWMDDKEIMDEKFERAGIPVPKGHDCWTERGALKIFGPLTPPVITKPRVGSRSRHTTTEIRTAEELLAGFQRAKVLCPSVLVEEQMSGFVYRVMVVGGKVAAVLRREPPHVTGDGKTAIKDLVVAENKNPLRHGPIFHKLQLNRAAIEDLKRQNLSPESVPAKGSFVTLGLNVGRSSGASNSDWTDKVHPDNLALFARVAEVLDDSLFGLDFMIEDMSRSFKEQPRSGVIECNSLPFIDLHHYPLYGKPRNVAGKVWDLIFPESAGD